MKILNVTDAEFGRYGRVAAGYPLDGLLAALERNKTSATSMK